ncbi:MAG: hypothetical protein JXB47_20740 [Anaerolineae bacterium]|nr:hypothetical protein [Anaerolineae bacterium]
MLWIDRMSQRYHLRPSEFLLGGLLEYQLDEAVAQLAVWFDDHHDTEPKGKVKPRKHSAEYLIDRLERAAREPRYADPMTLVAMGLARFEEAEAG